MRIPLSISNAVCLIIMVFVISSIAISSEPDKSLKQLKFGPSPTLSIKVPKTYNMKKPPVTDLWMGRLHIKLEATDLRDIVETVHTGKIEEQGDAANYEQWVCYTIPNTSGRIRVRLSAGEIDGGRVSDIRAGLIDMPDPTCPELPADYTPIRLNHNIWISTSSAHINRVYGKPSRRVGTWVHYEAERLLKIHGSEYTEYGILSLRYEKGHVVELRAYKTTQN